MHPSDVSLPRIQNSLEKIDASISDTMSEIKRVEEIIRASRGESNTKFDSIIEDNANKFAALKSDLSQMRSDVNAMRSGLGIKLESMEKRIVNLEVSLKKLEESLRQA